MPKIIFTTVGTSAMQKLKSPTALVDADLEVPLERNKTLYGVVRQRLITTLSQQTQRLMAGDADFFDTSAEIASLVAMHRHNAIGPITREDRLVLLCSDTLMGHVCAEANTRVLETVLGWPVMPPETVCGLRAEKPNTFQAGLESLKAVVESHCKGPEARWFNITGGFKGAIPYATLLAWDHRMNVAFLFERSTKVCIIPRPSNWPGESVFDEARQCMQLGLGALRQE